MIVIEIPISGKTIKIKVDDARQAVSFVKGLYKGDAGVSFETPNITTFATHKKNRFVQDKVNNIFDTLKNPDDGSFFQALENESMRKYYGLKPREDFGKLVHSLGLYIYATKLLGELQGNYPPEYRTQKHEELLKALRETIIMLLKRYEEEYGEFEEPEWLKMINDLNKKNE
jgi:hypothetical protein|tara:strand:- start:1397 stop:1912 length:516 start_codon:yes stop_codon:yes gene_type:complete